MAYRPILTHDVEWEGAVFVFGTADRALARLSAQQVMAQAGADVSPEERLQAMADLFVEAVVDWSGVEAADGTALECTLGNRRAIPFDDKVAVVVAYEARIREVEEGNDESPSTHTSPTATEDPTEVPASNGVVLGDATIEPTQ